ncbi:FAD-dependent oxidoreductase [Neobacillus massiliamazoniensis]|uniref:Monooxygenase n=1 Tax=Neobacillus massiliamazoniensis TaxID=1499688 RepID=A0A0U1P412_9BACI|nr:NAD(P)/FAD-dependent oxidoreductase [Neobacillus massiliamazoniensis]CRK85017.1 monooxygenase [Neobacillus massiliamazoniensis]
MKMTSHKKVLIIGCGIAGPALALFLKRAGIEAEIYEARSESDGYSLSLSCNGVAVLKELGLDQEVFAQGSPVSKWEMSNGKGKSLGGGELAWGGQKSVFIKRVPLGAIIADEAERQGIKIFRGKKLYDIEVIGKGEVIAMFQDSTWVSGDYLIGSDGIHSRTRQIIDPSFPGADYTGLINSGGYTSGLAISAPPETTQFIFCKRAFFGYHVSSTGYIYWFVNWPKKEEPVRGSFDGITEEQRRHDLLELFRDDQPFIREIITSAETTFPYFSAYALSKQPSSWHKGPIALMGDAAHAISPSSGQGASMALEDAIVLAKCLRDIPNVEKAFTTYEHIRRERTVKMYEVGERSDSGKYVINPFIQWFRDVTTPIFLKRFANPEASDWMYSYRVDWNTKVSP